MKRWWRDWKRGWSDDDLESVLRKTTNIPPGGMVKLTHAELRAHVAYMREQGKKSVFAA